MNIFQKFTNRNSMQYFRYWLSSIIIKISDHKNGVQIIFELNLFSNFNVLFHYKVFIYLFVYTEKKNTEK